MLQTDVTPQAPSVDRPKYIAIARLSLALLAVSFAPIFIRFGETELGPNGTVLNRLLVFLFIFGIGRVVAQWTTPQTDETTDPSPTRQWLLLGSVGIISVISLGLWAV